MKPPYPSVTSEWHNAPYDTIDPKSSKLSKAGQHVIVTGGGTGVGAAITEAFAEAGATVTIIGRRQEKLEESKANIEKLYSGAKVNFHVADTTDAKRMKEVAAAVGQWDVLVLNAGRVMKPASIVDSDVDDWWNVFETNVKGSFVTAHSFLPTRNPTGSSVLQTSAGIICLSAIYPPCHGASAYISSKYAGARLLEHIGAECPDVFTLAVHPGIVPSQLMIDSGMTVDTMEEGITDNPRLGANFMVWATSPEAAFLKGKFVYSNWDAEQLKARADEIQNSLILTVNVVGWPFEAKP